ncbi:tetratricopeptide repeat protein [Gallaecimonas mangrovi]|uniref:tetratricopeptide repeat protein n=1 Tax=Gallaecimonas mangrovi TaxID=2291597 RepID=UPI000E1FB886|nr:tetratricopeptide repeat protein [Gallaecimonas mangrovi]
MSVLNQMLKDLDKRGAVVNDIASDTHAGKPAKASWLWLLLLPAAAAMASAGWWLKGDMMAKTPPPVAAAVPVAPKTAAVLASVTAKPVDVAPAGPGAAPAVIAPPKVSAPVTSAPALMVKATPAVQSAPTHVTKNTALTPPKAASPVSPAVKAAPSTAAKVKREVLTPSQQAQGLYQSGLLAWQQQQVLEAESDWKKALAAKEDFKPARLALASLYQQQRRLEDAAAVLLPMSDSDSDISLALARVLVQQGKVADAYQQLEMTPPTTKTGLQLKAELARLSGNLPAAADQYRRLANRYPDDGRLWMALGLTLEGLHQNSDAKAAYQKALAAASLSNEARRYAQSRWQALGRPQ